MDATINVWQLRRMLAEANVNHTKYARACKLSRVYVSGILSGRVRPGELSRIKLARGLSVLGLSLPLSCEEVRHVS